MFLRRRVRRALLVVAFCLCTGCSTFRPAPLTGLMWAYLGESQTVRSLSVVVYTLDRPTCEVSRARDVKQPPSAAWAGITIPDECHQVAVGAGTDYWVFAYPGTGAVGASERD
jgi:hypothetical protein